MKIGWLASLPPSKRERFLDGLEAGDFEKLLRRWRLWSHVYQDPPDGEWALWLMVGGRGAGKTKAGAEWINCEVASGQVRRVGLIGETLHDARSVMVEGISGLLSPVDPAMRPAFDPSLRRLRWKNGTIGEIFSAEDPEQLRGPELDLVWADEFAKWRKPQDVFDMAQMCLRAGEKPRMLITTTPRKRKALMALLDDPANARTKAPTHANSANLSKRFLKQITARYGGTRLGRQELMADILEDDDSALWRRDWIDAGRVHAAPELRRIVVAVDPPVTSGLRSDACGIVAAGRCAAGEIYVLADRTVQGLSPAGWALAVQHAVEAHCADTIVAETNQGGELISALLRQAGAGGVRVKPVQAVLAKAARAGPVAGLYEQGHVHHVGSLPALEDEMCLFGGVEQGSASPDRVDALVWAVNALMPAPEGRPRVRAV